MLKDPICGADVDEKTIPAISTYHGKPYLFCGQKCKDTFDEDPDDYISAEELQRIAPLSPNFKPRSVAR